MTCFLHESPVLDGSPGQIHFLTSTNHLEEYTEQNLLLSSYRSGLKIKRITICYYKGGALFKRVGEAPSMRHQSHTVYDHGGSTSH